MARRRSFLGSLQGIFHRSSIPWPAADANADAEPFLEGEDNEKCRRQLICKLVVALMAYGSSVPRAEFLSGRAAERLKVEVNIAIFPSRVFLIFSNSEDNPSDETHLLDFDVDLDLAKLQEADELANSVGLHDTPLKFATKQLQKIVTTPSPYGMWWGLLGHSLSAATAALLFFSGTRWDALVSLFLGFIVGMFSLNSQSFPLTKNALEFLCAIAVSFVARVISVYFGHRDFLGHWDVCFFAMALSPLIWLLPGQALTIGLSEVIQSAILPGASRVVRALVVALQMGFGIMLGEKMAWWCADVPIKKTCSSSEISLGWGVLCFLGYAAATNVLLKAKVWQWPAMIFTSGIGMLVDSFISSRFGTEVSALLSALGIGFSGSLLGYFTKNVPLSITFAGIQVLLPNGIGLQGVEEFLENNVLSGIRFMTSMISICLSITMGLMLSKIVVRESNTGFFAAFPNRKKRHVLSFEETTNDNEEEENEQVTI